MLLVKKRFQLSFVMMLLREHVSLREHACVSSRGAQSTELVWILDFKQILLLLLNICD